MSNLNVFEALDFVDKVNYLEKINQEKEISAIPILFELCSKSHLDPLIESMILESLQALLIYNEEKAVHGLSHSNKKVKKVCLRVICEKKYSRAVTHLISLIQETKDQNFLADILFALSEFRNDELLPLFQKYIHHDDSVISTLAISMIGIFQDKTSIDLLCNIIENGELGENVLKCELNIGAAIEALMLMNDEKAFSFLVSKLHYKNLTGRYILHREFVKLGDRILPYIARVLNSDDVDMLIMACNVIGQIGSRRGATILAHYYDNNESLHPNVLYSLYEAMGNIPSMKSDVLLLDGLDEKDPLIMTVVISSLEKQVKPGILERLSEILVTDNEQSDLVVNAIVASKAMRIFKELYKQKNISLKLINCIMNSNDGDLISEFIIQLKDIGTERSIKDAVLLESKHLTEKRTRVLTVDDSKSVLAYYRRILNDMNFDVTTAENGLAAFNILENSHRFDIIITDMNMPVMNGIDFIRKVRSHDSLHDIPIIMITTESKPTQIKLAEEAGMNDCLKKPFQPDILKSKIYQLTNM